MPLTKNYQNRLKFHGVIQKIKVARFYWNTVYIRPQTTGQHRA